MSNYNIIEKLNLKHQIPHEQWVQLLESFTEEDRLHAQALAAAVTETHFGNRIYFRGIVEFSNICKNDCYYCGIRRSNANICRYLLTEEDILLCCAEGYRLGFRTFVLQAGENAYCTSDAFLDLILRIKATYPDCAITLSVGECSRAQYEAMYAAGADRYLLRHETADKAHYGALHPEQMSFDRRIACLHTLQEIGFQTGCGMMVGTPGQTPETLAKDMELLTAFRPAMVGIGPFLPHRDTPLAACPPGSRELTLFLLSLTRILLPDVLLPATTALETAEKDGRILGILAGCNVIMPNLSPQNVKKNYMLYDNKSGVEESAEESLNRLKLDMAAIGKAAVVGRGDHRDYERKL